MHNQLNILIKYLHFFHNLMDEGAPHPSQLVVAESIPSALEHFECELEKVLPILEQCDPKDYERVSDLFFGLFIPLRKYTVDVERFGDVWDEMWGYYYKQKTLKAIDRSSDEEAFACSRIEGIMNRIFNLILRFNSLPKKKIIYKKDLDRINTQVENFTKVSKKMCGYINALATVDVYKIKPTINCLIDVGVRIGDYRCELSFVRDAVQTIAEAYRLKNKNLKRRRNYC